MRRSICLTEPSSIRARHCGNYKFSFVTASNLPAKTLVRFDLHSRNRDTDWEVPQTNFKTKGNAIWLEMPDGKIVSAKASTDDEDYTYFDFTLPSQVASGDKFTIHLGSQDDKHEGNKAQCFVQRRRPFSLYLDPKGKGDFKESEIFTIDVKGNKVSNINVLAPSVVVKNVRFDVFVRFEDAYGNLTGYAPEDTLIELSYDQLRENLNWKLFVPETGFIALPNLYFNEPGLYRLRLNNTATKEEFVSSPIMCYLNESDSMYWGLLHGEAERYDSVDNIESALRHFRDDHALQFFATSTPESETETKSDDWKLISSYVAEFNEEERFVTMLGFQWNSNESDEGCRHIIYSKDSKNLLRKKDSKTNSLKKIYKSHSPKEVLSVPCLTMAKGYSCNFQSFHREFERVVEIYNEWGSSECTKAEGNTHPISATKGGISETSEGSIRSALNKNCRFGFVAGGQDNRGVYKNFSESGKQKQYTPGVTALLSQDYSRDSLFTSLYNRRCYATTGARMLISFNVAGMPMGSEVSTKNKPGLFFNRHINGFVAGTAPLKEIILIRNGEVIHNFGKQDDYFPFEYDDMDPIEKAVLKDSANKSKFAYYYLRATQADGHVVWSSPIWVDLEEKTTKSTKKK